MRLSLPRLKMPRLPGFSILVWISTALKGWVMGSREKDTDSLIMYDRTLLWLTFGLAAIGFIMVTSASMPIGQRLTNDPFFFAKRDGVYLSWHSFWRSLRCVCRWSSGNATVPRCCLDLSSC